MKYDFLIVGAGLAGSTFAYEARKKNFSCLVIDKRDHIAGNIFDKEKNGIRVHHYGPHIFNTRNEFVWKYVNKFVKFNDYVHKVKVICNNLPYSFPVNLTTLSQVFGITTIEEAKSFLNENKKKYNYEPQNFEEWVIKEIGPVLYEMFYKNFTMKQWGRHPKDLPAKIAKRIPIRFDDNDEYYLNSKQGIPISGYTSIAEQLLESVDVVLNETFETFRHTWKKYAKKLVFSGSPDELYEYNCGMLNYRTLRWEEENLSGTYQSNAMVNYSDLNVPYTKIVEHKHFNKLQVDHTIITKEYPDEFILGKERLYPVEDEKNITLYKKYKAMADADGIVLIGRLGTFKYIDMDQTIASTINIVNRILK